MRSILNSLSRVQQVSLVVAAVLVVAAIFGTMRWNRERDFKPLYTGVAAEDAGAVVAKLKEGAAEYRVTDGGATILVPSGKVAETRLQMAALGLPKTGRIGYELFDKTNFGATDFTEQVNYHRALEGELERSVMALNSVEQARVHLTLPKASLFLESRQAAKASVMVKLRPGAKLSPQNILAVTNLVASAVEGLTPDGVSLLDMQGNLLSRPRLGTGDSLEVSDAALDYRQRVEKDLLAKINLSLEPVLGPDKFRTSVSVDCDLTSGEQSEETYDPNRSVMSTSQKTEDIAGGSLANGVPGTASNLPRPTSRPGSSGTGTTRRTESINYQTSRLVRHTKLPQGAVKRMSIAVLVDQTVRWEGLGLKAKRIIDPPTPEKLKTIRDMVAGIAGFQQERGDQLIVETLPFESTLSITPPPAPEALPSAPETLRPTNYQNWLPLFMRKPNMLIYLGVGVGLLFALATITAIRLRRKKAQRAAALQKALHASQSAAAVPEGTPAENLRKQLEEKIAEHSTLKEKQEADALSALKHPQVKTQKTEVLTKHLSSETKKDPQAMAHILRAWLNEK
jgi:flagellar M-ring protein FliF